jgi:hypothetical protein
VSEKINNKNASLAFWGGLISIFCLGPLLGIPAIIVGNKAKREISEAPDTFKNASQANLGVIFGWITTILFIIAWVIAGVTFLGRPS